MSVTFTFAPAADEQGPSVIIVADAGYRVDFPLALFEVTGPRVSRFWELSMVVDSEARTTMATLGPPSVLHTSGDFLERLVEGEPTAVEEFDRVLGLLKAEAQS
jgi:hypothetical protein